MHVIKSGEYRLGKDGVVSIRPRKTFHLPDLPTQLLPKEDSDYMGFFSVSMFSAFEHGISITQALRNQRMARAYRQRCLNRHLALRNLYLIQSGALRNFAPICIIPALIFARNHAEKTLLSVKERQELENKRNPVVSTAYEFEIRADGRITKNSKIRYQAPDLPEEQRFSLPRQKDFITQHNGLNVNAWMREYEMVEQMNALKKTEWEKLHAKAHRKYQKAYRKQLFRDVIGYITGREYGN